jgi:hypothetical protein
MAVAGVIETKAYFRKRGTGASESPRPQKRRRVSIPAPEPRPPRALTPERHWPPPPEDTSLDPSPAPASSPPSGDPVTSEAARTALSTPWTGPADFRYGDDEVFESSNDISNDRVRFDPIIEDTYAEPGSSDTDSSTDGDDIGPSGSDTEGVPDIFETNADLNVAEHSE